MKPIINLCVTTLLFSQFAQAAEPDSSPEQSAVRVQKDVAYLVPERAEKADLYLPPTSEPGKQYPGILIIHGGGWTGGDKGAVREKNIGTTLALHGYVCMSINYALAKRGMPTFPRNIQDCKRAVALAAKERRPVPTRCRTHRGHRRLGGRASDGPAGGERARSRARSRRRCRVLVPHSGRGADVPPLCCFVGRRGAA